MPYYAAHRDAPVLPFAKVHLYADWTGNLSRAKDELAGADVGMVTSYCPDGIAAADLVLNSHLPRTVFYDMDTPVTLSRLGRGERVPYLPEQGLSDFDLVLSYTGGLALTLLSEKLGARRAEPLYGWVDPQIYYKVTPSAKFAADLSYLGTYSEDRQAALEQLLITPAHRLTGSRFVIAGAMYPKPECWPPNIRHFAHVAPPEHAAFYSSSPLTLNVTRGSMAAMGYCPSGRLFEAAACGTTVLSDDWKGLDEFFLPGEEILIATETTEAISALSSDAELLRRIGARARERTLDCHTADIRAQRLLSLIESSKGQDADSTAERSRVFQGA